MEDKDKKEGAANKDNKELYDFLKSESAQKLIELLQELIRARSGTHRMSFVDSLYEKAYYLIVIVLLSGCVTYLAYHNLIENTVTGTLLGGIIGYTLGASKKNDGG